MNNIEIKYFFFIFYVKFPDFRCHFRNQLNCFWNNYVHAALSKVCPYRSRLSLYLYIHAYLTATIVLTRMKSHVLFLEIVWFTKLIKNGHYSVISHTPACKIQSSFLILLILCRKCRQCNGYRHDEPTSNFSTPCCVTFSSNSLGKDMNMSLVSTNYKLNRIVNRIL